MNNRPTMQKVDYSENGKRRRYSLRTDSLPEARAMLRLLMKGKEVQG